MWHHFLRRHRFAQKNGTCEYLVTIYQYIEIGRKKKNLGQHVLCAKLVFSTTPSAIQYSFSWSRHMATDQNLWSTYTLIWVGWRPIHPSYNWETHRGTMWRTWRMSTSQVPMRGRSPLEMHFDAFGSVSHIEIHRQYSYGSNFSNFQLYLMDHFAVFGIYGSIGRIQCMLDHVGTCCTYG